MRNDETDGRFGETFQETFSSIDDVFGNKLPETPTDRSDYSFSCIRFVK